uniref:Uncharacterized protein n=1 Tax=Tanacetum cinerariifolium TaxID=118510 RepID=A0A6L2J3Z4_TANCI|nr:hypothetical protein [Tanacetum cinerariifolium]
MCMQLICGTVSPPQLLAFAKNSKKVRSWYLHNIYFVNGIDSVLLFTDLTIRGRVAVGLNPNMRLIGTRLVIVLDDILMKVSILVKETVLITL